MKADMVYVLQVMVENEVGETLFTPRYVTTGLMLPSKCTPRDR